jgi:hypothetical protein
MRRPNLPTRARDWRLMGRTARLVLGVPTYALVAVLAAGAGLTLFVATQNSRPIIDLVLGGPLPLGDRLSVLLGLYPFLGSIYGPITGTLLLVLAALIGVDVALVCYHLREHGLSAREGGSGVAGLVLGTLGAGCAACGTAILAGLLSLFGATGLVTLLPLEGGELSLVAIVVVVLSIHWLADGMRGGEIDGCPVDP